MAGHEELFTLGNEANKSKDYSAARDHFHAAYNLSPKPKYLLSAANMDLRIGTPEALREAKQWYTQLDQMTELPQKVWRTAQSKPLFSPNKSPT